MPARRSGLRCAAAPEFTTLGPARNQHQRPYGRQILLPWEREPLLLSACCRNTRRIYHLVMRFSGRARVLQRDPYGVPSAPGKA